MEKIKELIASGEYTTGGRLPTEQEMAERFGVGRSSIREAIKTFNYLGVLESKTAKGTFVCDSNSISSETEMVYEPGSSSTGVTLTNTGLTLSSEPGWNLTFMKCVFWLPALSFTFSDMECSPAVVKNE